MVMVVPLSLTPSPSPVMVVPLSLTPSPSPVMVVPLSLTPSPSPVMVVPLSLTPSPSPVMVVPLSLTPDGGAVVSNSVSLPSDGGAVVSNSVSLPSDGGAVVSNSVSLPSDGGAVVSNPPSPSPVMVVPLSLTLLIVVLFTALKRQRKQEPLLVSKEDVRDNVVSYNDEGGGEEDTQAYDIGALRHPESAAAAPEDSAQHRRDILPTGSLLHPRGRSGAPGPSGRLGGARAGAAAAARDNADVREFINQRVLENDCNPTAPPYDSLATYAYEGAGSVAESLSSLGSLSSEGEQDYHYLSTWGPRFRKLADLYGAEDAHCC
ncbi:unnamed protein product [Boreogadus saida]